MTQPKKKSLYNIIKNDDDDVLLLFYKMDWDMYFPDDFFFLQNTHLAGNYVLKTRKTCETHIKHTFSSQNHETYRLAARNIENMV